MQACADLSLLQFTEIGLRLIQNLLQRLRADVQFVSAGQARPVQLCEAVQHRCFKHCRSFRPELPCLDQFIQQSLELLQGTMQPCTADGWHEVIKNHRLAASFCLGPFARIVDDEGIEMGDGSEGEFGPTIGAQSHPLAGKPFGAAVFPHMQHHLGSVLTTQPQVLGQVAMRWRQIG